MFLCENRLKITFFRHNRKQMETMETNKAKIDKCKICKYQCIDCDYITNVKCNYMRHQLTPKHINLTNINKLSHMETKKDKNDKKDKNIFVQNESINICNNCNKIYQNRSGLWKHKRNCNKPISGNDVKTIVNTMNNDDELKKFLIEQNNEFKALILEQNKQIIELSSKPTTTNNNNNTTNNNFNLNFFLNETCKDALNISDFISQLHVGIKDLEETGRLGYAEGISKIFINGLKQLEINQRPLHCSDVKRETIYIKDENQWGKDNEEKTKLTKAIRKVAHKNIEQIAVWTEKNPEYMDYNSKYSEKYMKLIGEAMPGATHEESDKNYKKIARNISKETVIGK